MLQWQIFIAFLRAGMLGYGGGPSSIPLIHKEVVGRFKWMNDDEFADIFALANTLPGPINTKMAGYIGYRLAGSVGMINAVLATIVPTILLMILLLASLSQIKDQPWVTGMTKAVIPVVGVMLAEMAWDFFKKSKEGQGLWKTIFLTATSLIVIQFMGVHPGIVIAALLLIALAYPPKKGQLHTYSKGGNNQ
ncbi:chromate transporter [Schinkia sp. CFF1]